MNAGIREAFGCLLPFAGYQLLQRLQPTRPRAAAVLGKEEAAVEAEAEELDLLDEEEPEFEPELPCPSCPVVEGSVAQRYVRELSYCDDGWILLHAGVLALGPFVLWKLFLSCARFSLGPLKTPRRNVSVVAPRARRPSSGAGTRQR